MSYTIGYMQTGGRMGRVKNIQDGFRDRDVCFPARNNEYMNMGLRTQSYLRDCRLVRATSTLPRTGAMFKSKKSCRKEPI